VKQRDVRGVQHVEIWCRPGSTRVKELLVPKWVLPATAKPVQGGDIVCLLQGAWRPTIIRPQPECDHFLIVIIESSPLDDIRLECPTRDFLLVWDWSQYPGTSLGVCHEALDRVCGKLTRLLHSTLIMKDV
jgi:hypothetical protein